MRLLYLGPIALFLAAAAWGVLEIHSSTDTWIGLAGGRAILENTDWTNLRETFPRNDTFSYTFDGELWFNQNWLTHVFQYWLYSHVSRDAVVYGTWLLASGVFWFVLLAAYWRSGSWLGALLAAAVVGLGCRDFLSARPATTGFFCISALWALVCALEGQRGKTRWWPIVLLLPLLFLWGNAHGSFVFGYGTLALYVGYWFLTRTIGHKFSWAFSLVARADSDSDRHPGLAQADRVGLGRNHSVRCHLDGCVLHASASGAARRAGVRNHRRRFCGRWC